MFNFLDVPCSSSPPLAALHTMTEMKNGCTAGNPHGIEQILSRPPTTGAAAAISHQQRAFNSVAGIAAAGMAAAASYFHNGGVKHPATTLADLTTRNLYWPGFQGLVNNPIAWRDRLASREYIISQYDLHIPVSLVTVVYTASSKSSFAVFRRGLGEGCKYIDIFFGNAIDGKPIVNVSEFHANLIIFTLFLTGVDGLPREL